MDQTQWQRDFEKARDAAHDADIRTDVHKATRRIGPDPSGSYSDVYADVKAATCAVNAKNAKRRLLLRSQIALYQDLLENDVDAAPTLKAMICDRLGDLYKELSRDTGVVQ